MGCVETLKTVLVTGDKCPENNTKLFGAKYHVSTMLFNRINIV